MIVILIFCVTYFAYVLGCFNNAVANFDNLWTGEDNMANLNSWFQNIAKYKSKLPKQLQKELVQHFFYFWKQDRIMCIRDKGGQHWSNLPTQLKSKIFDFLIGDVIYSFPKIFLPDKAEANYSLALCLQPRKF